MSTLPLEVWRLPWRPFLRLTPAAQPVERLRHCRRVQPIRIGAFISLIAHFHYFLSVGSVFAILAEIFQRFFVSLILEVTFNTQWFQAQFLLIFLWVNKLSFSAFRRISRDTSTIFVLFRYFFLEIVSYLLGLHYQSLLTFRYFLLIREAIISQRKRMTSFQVMLF